MVSFHGKPLCFCGSDLQTGSQFLPVQDNIRRPAPWRVRTKEVELGTLPGEASADLDGDETSV